MTAHLNADERWSEMTKILIAYGTTEGQTARIADHIAGVIRSRGFEAQAVDLKRSKDVPLNAYNAVIVGGSIHMGKHQDEVADFVRTNRAALEGLPSAVLFGELGRARRHGERRGVRRELRAADGLASH